MSERDRYMPGVPCWIDTSQPDPEAAVDFYAGLFGWELEDGMPADAPGHYFTARLPGGDVAAISSVPEGAPPSAMWNTYIWVESADETAAKVTAAGGSVLTEPFDVMEAGRMAVVADPDGAVFCVWQAKEHRGAAVVNEPGSLNFNDLYARDLESAERFYGSVFGWRVLELGDGRLWTLPGYGDHLEALNPGMREGMAEMGAPEGFEDVVASLGSLDAQTPGAAPHWGVTFAVDHADATAKHAAELGGRVIAEPLDAPWTRVTVLADPQGATFTAAQFVPENRDLATPANAAAEQ